MPSPAQPAFPDIGLDAPHWLQNILHDHEVRLRALTESIANGIATSSADTVKITELPVATLADDSLILVVDDPSGLATSKQASIAALRVKILNP